VILAHSNQSGGADLSSHGHSVLTVEELLLHCIVSEIIDFIIKQVSRTRPMIATHSHESSAGAINHLLVRSQ